MGGTQASTEIWAKRTPRFRRRTISDNPRRSGLISLTSTFTPSLLGELRVSYTRFGYSDSWDREGFDISTLGFPQSLAQDVQYKTFPTISVSQYTVGTGLSVTGGSSAEVGDLAGAGKNYTPQDTYQLQYHVTYLRNRHKFKMGVDLQSLRLSTFNTIAPAGRYFFDRVYTQGPDPSQRSSTSGSGFASLLLGVPVSGNLSFGPALRIYGKYYGFYFQDDVQITSKLLRTSACVTNTRLHGLRSGAVSATSISTAEPVTGAKGTYVRLQPGQYIYDPQKNNWSPRVGIAYRATPKTVCSCCGRNLLRRE